MALFTMYWEQSKYIYDVVAFLEFYTAISEVSMEVGKYDYQMY